MKAVLFCFSLLAVCINHEVQADFVNGSVRVSSGALPKILKSARLVLAKFDDLYPYGDKFDEYKIIAAASVQHEDWLCVEIGVADYGEKDNLELAERYHVKKDDFPVYMLFKDGKMESPVRHKGSFKADDVKAFVAREGGIYIGLVGCLEEFDKLAMRFVRETDVDKKKLIISEALGIYGGLTKDSEKESGDFYIKTMEKLIENPKFVGEEVTRIKKLKDGKVSDKKKAQMNVRLNILTTFRIASPKKKLDKIEL